MKNSILFKLGFFMYNADNSDHGGKFKEAMDAIGFPSGTEYRREKFGLMQRNVSGWLGCLGNDYLIGLEKWLDENVSDDSLEWK